VPHVHAHVIPRRSHDLASNDDIYHLIHASSEWISKAAWAGSRGDATGVDAAWHGLSASTSAASAATSLDPADFPRVPRPLPEMEAEAAWYRSLRPDS